ncbi:MAG TPA: sterol desaturase family protein [Azospirillaceae bacterium]|nr:sterol desaturase family protein [Azospirillaceae bacterium]
MTDLLFGAVAVAQQWLFETVVGPLLFAMGLAGWHEDAFDALEGVVVGLYGLVILFLVLRPLEAWRPVERWADRREARVDIVYSVLNRVGIVPLILFLLMDPLERQFASILDDFNMVPWTLEYSVPMLADRPLLTMFIYVLILDFAEYWRHRLQHRLNWWWALHALHHSQRQMTLWSDTRNHVIDDLLRQVWLLVVALAVGAPPSSYLAVVMLIMAVESLAHANVRLSFGKVGDRLLVSPLYHRIHHAIEQAGAKHGCNFAVLFPVWDIVFRTARFDPRFLPTGIADDDGPAYEGGFLRHQATGFVRVWKALTARA